MKSSYISLIKNKMKDRNLNDFGFYDPLDLKIRKLGGLKMGEWKKVEDTIFKFEQVGSEIEGVLIGSEDSKTFNNKVYKIKSKDGKIFTVFGTAILDSQLACVALNQTVRIVHTGSKPNKHAGQNPIRLFDVFVK